MIDQFGVRIQQLTLVFSRYFIGDPVKANFLVDDIFFPAAFQQREEEISLNILGQTYTVDFHSMTQVNEGSGNSRPIQRRIHPASAQSGFATGLRGKE